MARIRTVKPEFWDDEKMARLSLQSNLLFIGMWNFCDDTGVIRSGVSWIKSKVFPHREDLRVQDVTIWIQELENARLVVPFQFNDEGYYLIRTFSVHQRIDKPQPSKIPVSVLQSIFSEIPDCSENIPRTFLPVLERKGMDKERIVVAYAHDGEVFRNKYDEWVEFLKEKRKPPTQKSINSQGIFLKNYSEEIAIQIIETSIMNNWQGLFAPKNYNNGSHQRTFNNQRISFDEAAKAVIARGAESDRLAQSSENQ